MRNIIAVSGIAVFLIVVAALLRWRAARRSRVHELPPLFFPLAKDNEGRPPNFRDAIPIPATHAREIAMGESRAVAATGVEATDANPAAGVGALGASGLNAQSQVANPKIQGPATDVANAKPAVVSHVNNGANSSTANAASNGASSAHVVNGRASGIAFVPPNVGRPNVPPPPINTPTHLKVVRDLPDFPDENAPAPDETVRFRRPTDEAVQLLPGRLQVVSGDPRHQEIRFVRIPGRPAELILGREPGDTAQHVALHSSTVSRKHARFAFHEGRWHVVNLSHTNPVVVNGEELSSSDRERPLNDGDQIELGEVVLRFRSH